MRSWFTRSGSSPIYPGPTSLFVQSGPVSSFKFGFGAECLLDGDPDTFWQYVPHSFRAGLCHLHLASSDGPQPHFITIEFPRKMAIQASTSVSAFYFVESSLIRTQKISIQLNFPLDDSYTPSTLAIRAGTGPSDLQDVRVITLDKPVGWITFDVSSEPNENGDGL